MLDFKDWIFTEEAKKLSFVLADLPNQIFLKWIKKNIKNKSLFEEKGIEEETHVTVIANLETENPKLVEKILSDTKEFEIKLGKISMFTSNEKFDVLKIEVVSKELLKIHNLLKNKIPNIQNHEFKPHCTSAYLKKGEHKDLIDNPYFLNKKYKIKKLLFSNSLREKTEINLKRNI